MVLFIAVFINKKQPPSQQIKLMESTGPFMRKGQHQGRNMVYGLRGQSTKYDWDQGSEQRAPGSEEWDQGSQGF